MTDLSRAVWRKSPGSDTSDKCVEIADNLPGVVAVRDSKNPDGPVLVSSVEAWQGFIDGIKAGEFD